MSDNNQYRFDTLAVHAGWHGDSATDATAVPIYRTTAFNFQSAQDGADRFGLRKAANIYACATHGVLSGPALGRIEESPITELLLLDTIPYPASAAPIDKISYLTTAPVFAESIRRIHEERSLFTVENS